MIRAPLREQIQRIMNQYGSSAVVEAVNEMTTADMVNHPPHYAIVPGVECIDVVQHFNFCRGNAIKYIWRAGSKGNELEDLRKARWYLDHEIAQLEKDHG